MASLVRAFLGRGVAEYGGRYEAWRELSAPLGDEKLEVHDESPVQVLRRGVRRCLNGRHARAGRSPRPGEVGAQRRTQRVDRPSTRGTLGRHPTNGPLQSGAAGRGTLSAGQADAHEDHRSAERAAVRKKGNALRGAAGDFGVSLSKLLQRSDRGTCWWLDVSTGRQVAASARGARKRQRPSPGWAETALRARFARRANRARAEGDAQNKPPTGPPRNTPGPRGSDPGCKEFGRCQGRVVYAIETSGVWNWRLPSGPWPRP